MIFVFIHCTNILINTTKLKYNEGTQKTIHNKIHQSAKSCERHTQAEVITQNKNEVKR